MFGSVCSQWNHALPFTAVDYPMQLLPNSHHMAMKRSTNSFRQVQYHQVVSIAIHLWAMSFIAPIKTVDGKIFAVQWV